MGEVIYLYGDPWLDKKGLARELGVSVSFVEKRMRDGLPSRMMGNKRQFRLRAAEAFLRENGFLIEEEGA